jgi:hypothetical protein
VALLGLAAAAIFVAPVAAFHFLPPTVTGEEAKLSSALELSPGRLSPKSAQAGERFQWLWRRVFNRVGGFFRLS